MYSMTGTGIVARIYIRGGTKAVVCRDEGDQRGGLGGRGRLWAWDLNGENSQLSPISTT